MACRLRFRPHSPLECGGCDAPLRGAQQGSCRRRRRRRRLGDRSPSRRAPKRAPELASGGVGFDTSNRPCSSSVRAPCSNLRQRRKSSADAPAAVRSLADLDVDPGTRGRFSRRDRTIWSILPVPRVRDGSGCGRRSDGGRACCELGPWMRARQTSWPYSSRARGPGQPGIHRYSALRACHSDARLLIPSRFAVERGALLVPSVGRAEALLLYQEQRQTSRELASAMASKETSEPLICGSAGSDARCA